MELKQSGNILKFVILTVILLSPSINLAVGHLATATDEVSISLDQSSHQFHPTPPPDVGEIPKSISGNKILMYDTFEQRDAALLSLRHDQIGIVYKYIPAVAVRDITPSEIAKEGLSSITEDMKFQRQVSQQQRDIDFTVSNSFTLHQTANMTGIEDIRDQYGLSGDGVTIGILDSGVNDSLESFDNRVQLSVVDDLASRGAVDEDGHGTHVTGIAAGNGFVKIDGEWVETNSPGMAPGAMIKSIRVLDETGAGDNSWIIDGIERAIDEDVDIISMSLSTVLYEGDNDPMEAVINEAVEAGIVVVAAAGNTGPIGSAIGIPGAFEGVIAVGASFPVSTSDQELWSFSGIGPAINDYPGPDLIAPGARILSINSTDGTLSKLTGTSMAAPHISGGVALLKEAYPNATVNQIREALLASAEFSYNSDGSPDHVEGQGRGQVRFDLAYQILNKTISSPNSHLVMPVMPNLVYDRNFVYHHRLIGETKTLPFFFHSSRSLTIEPVINASITSGYNFDLPQEINLTEGRTRIDLTMTNNASRVGPVFGSIYFVDQATGDILPNSVITIESFAKLTESRILFDTAHDLDTNSSYFGNHGPIGQYSQLAKSFNEEGHIVHQSGNQTIDDALLADYDVLVIANPDRNYTTSEISDIRSFLEDDGKSLFIIVGGGLLSAEGVPTYAQFNREGLNSILNRTGISIPEDETPYSLTPCDYALLGYEARINTCVSTGQVTNTQSSILAGLQFPHYGPQLALEVSDDIDYAEEVAFSRGELVAAAAQFPSQGRVMVFSSPLAFDNNGILYDYPGPHSAVNNEFIAVSILNWLIQPRQASMEINVAGQQGVFFRADMYEEHVIVATPTDKDGELITDLGNEINMTVVERNSLLGNAIYNFTFFRSENSGDYTGIFYPTRDSRYSFYFHLTAENSISTDSFFEIVASLKNFDKQDEIRQVATFLFFLILISWVLWLRNEGGRELWRKRREEQM